MKRIRDLMTGIVIGALLMVGATAGYAAVKKYNLTEASYPIYVDGSKYVDSEYPILNYEGSTYVPLAKLGDITGVNYKWNDALKRVEINVGSKNEVKADTGTANEVVNLTVVDATGKYAGYKMLKGYPDSDKYQIYFKGNASSYKVTTEDLRNINMNELISWSYKGTVHKTSKKDLHAFFIDTVEFKNYLGDFDYTFTAAWYEQTFGDVYREWADGFEHENEAARWVQKYFQQTSQHSASRTLTPDAVLVPVDIPIQDPSIDEVIRSIEKLNQDHLPPEEIEFQATWISQRELENNLKISVSRFNDRIKIEKQNFVLIIEEVPALLEPGKIMKGNNVRYQYSEGNEYRSKGLYFHRDDLRKLEIIK